MVNCLITARKRSLGQGNMFTGGVPAPGSGGGGGAGGDPPDAYCCGRYASYWNAFLFNDFGHVCTFYGKQGSVSLQRAIRFLKFNPLEKVLAGAKPLINNTA